MMYLALVICFALLIGIASVIRDASPVESPDSPHCAMVAPCAVEAVLPQPWAPDDQERDNAADRPAVALMEQAPPIAATPPLGWLDTTNSLPPGHRYPWRPAIEQPDTGAWMAHASSLPSFDFLDDTSSMPRRHNVPWRPRPQPDDVAVWAHVAAEQSARGSDRA
jgi:hypothetical protein